MSQSYMSRTTIKFIFSHYRNTTIKQTYYTMQTQLLICIPTMFFLIVLIVLIGCGFDVEDPTPPSPPMWVEKSLLEEWPERGKLEVFFLSGSLPLERI
jgi:hypothetical protein